MQQNCVSSMGEGVTVCNSHAHMFSTCFEANQHVHTVLGVQVPPTLPNITSLRSQLRSHKQMKQSQGLPAESSVQQRYKK